LKNIFFIISAFLFIINTSKSQELLPFVENFTITDYDGDNQVWSVTQGDDKAMYFANNHYLLRYNGVKWHKYTLPNKTIIRSVLADKNRIYCGSYTEFGYWERHKGEMKYKSLSKGKNLFNGYSDNEEIWKIFKFDNKIYFQSFNDLFIYDHLKVEKVRLPFQISYCFVVDNEIYLATVREGVFKYQNKKFIKIERWKSLENNVIHAIELYKNTKYIFTQKNGVYIDNAKDVSTWMNSLNVELKHDIIITAKFLTNDRLAIGTAFKGLYLIDMKTGDYININRSNSLKNNSVLNIGIDNENDIWLGLDNGIAHIEVNSPYAIFSDNTGILGSVYAVSFLENGFLLGSNHGLFTFENKKLNVLPNSQGHVWDILRDNNKYIIGHNDGTFVYQNGVLSKENIVNGGWNILNSNYDSKLYQANYSGIVFYEDINYLKKYSVVPNLTKPIKKIAQIKPMEVWAVDNYKNLYRIQFKPDFTLDKIENVLTKSGLKNNFEIKIFQFKNQLFFLIDGIWYQFNSLIDKLEKHKLFNTHFGENCDIIPINDDNFLVLKNKLLYIIHPKKGSFIWELIPSKYYEGKIIGHNTKVFQNGETLFFNLDDGFFTFQIDNKKIKPQNIFFEGYYKGQKINNEIKIEYNQSIEINVISDFFGYNRSSLFYKVNQKDEFQPIFKGSLILNNLTSGHHMVEVFTNDGLRYNKIGSYSFYVERPWYFSLEMILVYILLGSLVFYLYYKWNKFRYTGKLKLKEEELKHQKEILKIELETQNKLRQQEYEKNILEMQVQSKASEVAGKSLSIAKQSEMIDSIQLILETETNVSSIKNKINKSIKINAINKKEWESFENNIYQSHELFVSKITKKYPNLTSKDIKLSIYLKMNLTSKEIAPLLNISYRGVELHRYRLRKKLNLTSEDNLSSFMINL